MPIAKLSEALYHLKNTNYVRGSQLPGRITNAVSRWYDKTNVPLDRSLTIFGLEKPYIENINGKMYWRVYPPLPTNIQKKWQFVWNGLKVLSVN